MNPKLQELIDGLPAEELDEVRNYIAFRSSKATAGKVSPKDFDYWRALSSAMSNGSDPSEGSLIAFLSGKYGRSAKGGFGVRPYRNAIERVESYIRIGVGRAAMNKAERHRLLTKCFEAVVLRLHHMAIPVSPAIVLQHAASSLDAAMEWQYPGYYRARLLYLLAKGDANHAAH